MTDPNQASQPSGAPSRQPAQPQNVQQPQSFQTQPAQSQQPQQSYQPPMQQQPYQQFNQTAPNGGPAQPQSRPSALNTAQLADKANEFKQQATGFAQQLEGKQVNVAGQSFNYLSLITLISAVVIVVSVFLPFASASAFGISISASLIDGGDGWILLVLAVITGVLAYLKKHVPALVLAVISLALVLFEMVHSSSVISEYGSLGVGAWLLLLASVAMLVGTVLTFLNEKNKAAKSGPNDSTPVNANGVVNPGMPYATQQPAQPQAQAPQPAQTAPVPPQNPFVQPFAAQSPAPQPQTPPVPVQQQVPVTSQSVPVQPVQLTAPAPTVPPVQPIQFAQPLAPAAAQPAETPVGNPSVPTVPPVPQVPSPVQQPTQQSEQ